MRDGTANGTTLALATFVLLAVAGVWRMVEARADSTHQYIEALQRNASAEHTAIRREIQSLKELLQRNR